MRVRFALLLLGALAGAAVPAAAQPAHATASAASPRDRALALHARMQELVDQRRFAEAIAALERELPSIGEALGAADPLVGSLELGLAQLQQEVGAVADSERSYERAIEKLGISLGLGHHEVAGARSSLAELYMQTGDFLRAEPLYRDVVRWAQQAGARHVNVALSKSNLANMLRVKGAHAESLATFADALSILEENAGRDAELLVPLLRQYARALDEAGQYPEAVAMLRRAVAIVDRGGNWQLRLDVLGDIEHLFEDHGDYLRAVRVAERALEIAIDLGPPEARVHYRQGLASLLGWAGEKARALESARQMLTEAQQVYPPDDLHLAAALNAAANVHARHGAPADADALMQRALAIFARHGPSVDPIRVDLFANAAGIARDIGRQDEATRLLAASVELAERIDHHNLDLVLNNAGTDAFRAGDVVLALQRYERAVALAEARYGAEHPMTASIRDNLAGALAAGGDAARALSVLERSLETTERYLRAIETSGSEPQLRRAFTATEPETSLAVSLGVRLAPASEPARRLALLTVLRRKGRALDAFGRSVAQLRQSSAGDDLLAELRSVRTQIAALGVGPRGQLAADEADRALERLREREERLAAEVSDRRGVAGGASVVVIAGVQRAIPAGGALLELFVYRPSERGGGEVFGAPRYAGFVLRRDGEPVLADLGSAAEIDREAVGLRRALATREPWQDAAQRLEHRLLDPFRAALAGVETLIVAPDGELNLIPFAALPAPDGRLWRDRAAVAYVSSGRDLLREPSSTPATDAPILFAAPTFPSLAGDDESRRSSALGRISLPPLPATVAEATAVHALLSRAEQLSGDRASEARLKSLRRPALLHLATHGFFLADQPVGRGGRAVDLIDFGGERATVFAGENPLLRSGLFLAADDEEDGIVTALEVAGLDLSGTRLVVLSACETGVGEVLRGQGVYGLRRALDEAGAERVVMSLWKVADESTRDLMIAYYQELAGGHSSPLALARAQRRIAAKPEWAHPFFWAAFIPSGLLAPPSGLPFEKTSVPPVERSPRGCACNMPARDETPPWALLLAALALWRLRRQRRVGKLCAIGLAQAGRSATACTTRAPSTRTISRYGCSPLLSNTHALWASARAGGSSASVRGQRAASLSGGTGCPPRSTRWPTRAAERLGESRPMKVNHTW